MPSPHKLTKEQADRLKKIATLASVCLAVSLSLIKTFGSLYTGSLAVLSSLMDSLSDIFASSITFIAVKFSSMPASYDHRYGYGKAESLSALIQSAFVAGSGIFIMYDGVSRIFYPRPVEQTGVGILIMVISLVATLALIAFQKHVTNCTRSQAISADSAHYTVDVLSNASVILTLVVVSVFHLDWFDTLTAFVISSYLLYNAYKIASEAIHLLMDAELSPEIRNDIKRIVRESPFAEGIHDLRTRDLGGCYMFEFHLELDGDLSLSAAHDLTDLIEDNIREKYPDAQIIIHQDPAGIKEERLDQKIRYIKK